MGSTLTGRDIRSAFLLFAFLLTVFFLITSILASAQSTAKAAPCSQEELMSIKGKWVRDPDALNTGLAHSYSQAIQQEAFKREDKAFQFLQAAWPDPKGIEVDWNRSIGGKAPGKSGAMAYTVGAGYFHLFCDPDLQHINRLGETSGGFGIHFNQFTQHLFFDTSMHVGHYYVTLMLPRVGQWKGVDLFTTSLVRPNDRLVIISREGQYPLTMLTRRQYLAALKKKLQNEEDYQIALALKTSRNDDMKNKSLVWTAAHFDPKIKRIDDYVAGATEDDLAQTALVREMTEFTKFITEKEGGRIPMIANEDYFRPKQTAYFPQFIAIYWTWDDGQGYPGSVLRPTIPDMDVCCRVDKFFEDSMEQNLNPDAFRQLLDK